MTATRTTTHMNCSHESTKAARAKCRRDAKIALIAGDQVEAATTKKAPATTMNGAWFGMELELDEGPAAVELDFSLADITSDEAALVADRRANPALHLDAGADDYVIAPRGTKILLGDVVTLGGSKIQRRVVYINREHGNLRATRLTAGQRHSVWTKQLNTVKIIDL